MTLKFNKITFEGHWFTDDEDTAGYTDKIPPDTAHLWNEELGEWVLPEPEPEPETPDAEEAEDAEHPALSPSDTASREG